MANPGSAGEHKLQRRHGTEDRAQAFYRKQMLTYLTQFERDFLADADAGLAVIDATEGGVAKRHTTPMSLANALEKFMPDGTISIPSAAQKSDPDRTKAVRSRVRMIRRDIARVASLARETRS
ncbi:MAG: hypothetical protein IIC02_13370, partial [Planctomycetes bacterium]|nr:hypothetical protein [Planctomycetota bacterium]